jgi:hypothetical protein
MGMDGGDMFFYINWLRGVGLSLLRKAPIVDRVRDSSYCIFNASDACNILLFGGKARFKYDLSCELY